MDAPQFTAAWKPVALAHYAALKSYRTMDDIDWTFLSPADRVEPGVRTGQFRTGQDELIRDAEGRSYISAEDLAVAVVDELEKPKHVRQRFTIAY
jgi:uncharacterized protein